VALELFAAGEYDRELPAMRRRLETVAAALAGLRVRCRVVDAGDGETPPVLHVTLATGNAFDVCGRLRCGRPPVQVGHGLLCEGTLVVHPLHLEDESTAVLARRLREELAAEGGKPS
jgi:hypothetical protein